MTAPEPDVLPWMREAAKDLHEEYLLPLTPAEDAECIDYMAGVIARRAPPSAPAGVEEIEKLVVAYLNARTALEKGQVMTLEPERPSSPASPGAGGGGLTPDERASLWSQPASPGAGVAEGDEARFMLDDSWAVQCNARLASGMDAETAMGACGLLLADRAARIRAVQAEAARWRAKVAELGR